MPSGRCPSPMAFPLPASFYRDQPALSIEEISLLRAHTLLNKHPPGWPRTRRGVPIANPLTRLNELDALVGPAGTMGSVGVSTTTLH